MVQGIAADLVRLLVPPMCLLHTVAPSTQLSTGSGTECHCSFTLLLDLEGMHLYMSGMCVKVCDGMRTEMHVSISSSAHPVLHKAAAVDHGLSTDGHVLEVALNSKARRKAYQPT